MLLQLIDVPHWFLQINMFLRVGFSGVSRRWCNGVVFMQWMVHITLMSCCSNSCCQTSVKLLANFAFHSSASRVGKSTELLWHKTPDFTPDVAFQQTRPQFCRLLRLLRVVQECVCQKQQGMSNIVDELWLLTEWYFIKRMTYYISQRRVEAPIRIGGQLCHNYVANLLTICMPKIIENIMQLNKVIAN